MYHTSTTPGLNRSDSLVQTYPATTLETVYWFWSYSPPTHPPKLRQFSPYRFNLRAELHDLFIIGDSTVIKYFKKIKKSTKKLYRLSVVRWLPVILDCRFDREWTRKWVLEYRRVIWSMAMIIKLGTISNSWIKVILDRHAFTLEDWKDQERI